MTSTPQAPSDQRPPQVGAPVPPDGGPTVELERGAPPQALPPAPRPDREDPRPARLVWGVMLLAVGAGWLLDELGISVPWALLPAAALVLTGVALVLTARARTGHGPLAALGAVLVLVAALVSVVPPVAGPMGDRTITPTTQQWPVSTSLSAGNLTIDLTEHALPASGRLTADVGAGTVLLLLPDASSTPVAVTAEVGMGQVRVDGLETRSGMGIDWATGGSAPVTIQVRIGTGQLEVRHG